MRTRAGNRDIGAEHPDLSYGLGQDCSTPYQGEAFPGVHSGVAWRSWGRSARAGSSFEDTPHDLGLEIAPRDHRSATCLSAPLTCASIVDAAASRPDALESLPALSASPNPVRRYFGCRTSSASLRLD